MLRRFFTFFALFCITISFSNAFANTKMYADSVVIKTDSVNYVIRIPHVELADSTTEIPWWEDAKPSILFIPIIFEHQRTLTSSIPGVSANGITVYPKQECALSYDRKWLDSRNATRNFEMYHINRIIEQHPALVRYNVGMLPEAPKEYVIVAKPNQITLSLEEKLTNTPDKTPEKSQVKYKSWIDELKIAIQFSQAYLSDNWYQGGNSNLNLFGNFNYNIKLNTNVHPNLLFENNFQYKISLNSAPQDSLRNYSISDDLFQLNTKFGYKAVKNWYYTATLMFKTQFFNNYTVNTRNIKASFLSPGELNFGIGMTYSTTNKKKTFNFNLSIAPLSYNMKICTLDRLKSKYGITSGSTKSQFGSNLEGKLTWKMSSNISMNTRLFVFTNYDYLQGDLENTLNFSINKYLSTQLYFHLRYDTSTDSHPDWKKWQFKEILSFGLNIVI